jgi:hypothetical protein
MIHTHTHTHTLSKNPLDKGSARRREFYVRTHDIYNIQTSIPLAGFEPAIPGSERPQMYALDFPPTVRGYILIYYFKYMAWRLF